MTGRRDPYRITTAPSRRRTARTWHGILAVLALFLTAADALGTAVIGIPPVAWLWGRLAAVVTAAYRGTDPSGTPVTIAGRPIPEITEDSR
jgi:hypothetical protein